MSLPVIERPYRSVRVLTPSDVTTNIVKPGKALRIVASVAGNVTFFFPDGTSDVIPVAVGLTMLSLECARIAVTGTTATATYANWD